MKNDWAGKYCWVFKGFPIHFSCQNVAQPELSINI